MKFEFNVEQKVVHLEGESVLVTRRELGIDRDEFINGFEADDNLFLSTLREAICIFHLSGGMISQMSDYSMTSMYETFLENPTYKRIVYLVVEEEHLLEEDEYNRKKNVDIDFFYE